MIDCQSEVRVTCCDEEGDGRVMAVARALATDLRRGKNREAYVGDAADMIGTGEDDTGIGLSTSMRWGNESPRLFDGARVIHSTLAVATRPYESATVSFSKLCGSQPGIFKSNGMA
jgi:hypothetical protein